MPDLYNGLRGSYHDAEMAYFFDNFDKMNIPITEKNRSETAILQADWIPFIKEGVIPGRERYDQTRRITDYDARIASVSFPKKDVIERLVSTDVCEKARRAYVQNMKEEPTGKV